MRNPRPDLDVDLLARIVRLHICQVVGQLQAFAKEEVACPSIEFGSVDTGFTKDLDPRLIVRFDDIGDGSAACGKRCFTDGTDGWFDHDAVAADGGDKRSDGRDSKKPHPGPR